ncbi:MAG: erythromycin biosynthesis sensory transduction protein eryC1 [Archangium gephyra]|uniref:Erythromycin biosynthesis sensory transduction protein eryC1 n=1 Tax=Archangium gephyra TaxID=48 RepID=A0A2W5TSU3_9BACT|nr:MAG: erythromycin biosynthesis sensory transduction protein eryC1 [Archangium gephyra]
MGTVGNAVPFLSLRDATEELQAEIADAVARVIASGHYIGGPEVEAFEAEFAQYVGARHCIGVANGLDALTLSLTAMGLQRGDEVLVPSNTFIATWLGVTHAGGVPVAVEPDFESHVVTPEAMAAAITPRTRALMPVHLYGVPVDVPAMKKVAEERGLLFVEDAAQAHGATVGATRIGGFGTTATWSFYPGKNLGALGDAGAVTTDDDALAGRLRLLRNYGSAVKYVHDVVGFNSRLDPIQAAILRVKLRHLDAWNARRQRIADFYLSELRGLTDLKLPSVPAGRTTSWHLFVVRTSRRDALRTHLDAAGVGTLVHYPVPPHQQRAYASTHGQLAATELAAREVLSLPIGPQLSMEDAASVVSAVRRFFS